MKSLNKYNICDAMAFLSLVLNYVVLVLGITLISQLACSEEQSFKRPRLSSSPKTELTDESVPVIDFAYRKLIQNLGLHESILQRTRLQQFHMLDQYLKGHFDVTINPEDTSYRIYISLFEALDIFNETYMEARKELAEYGLSAIFKGEYKNNGGADYIVITLQDKWLRSLKAVPPLSWPKVEAYRKLLRNQLNHAIQTNPIWLEDHTPSHRDSNRTFDELWVHYRDLDINNNYDSNDPLPRIPLTLLPRSIWLLISHNLGVQYSNLLTLPSLPGRDNYIEIANLVDITHNNIRKIPHYHFISHVIYANNQLWVGWNPPPFDLLGWNNPPGEV